MQSERMGVFSMLALKRHPTTRPHLSANTHPAQHPHLFTSPQTQQPHLVTSPQPLQAGGYNQRQGLCYF